MTTADKIFYTIVGLLLKIAGVILIYYSMCLMFETWDSKSLESLEKILRITIYGVGAYFGAKVYGWSYYFFYILHIKLENSDIDIYI